MAVTQAAMPTPRIIAPTLNFHLVKKSCIGYGLLVIKHREEHMRNINVSYCE